MPRRVRYHSLNTLFSEMIRRVIKMKSYWELKMRLCLFAIVKATRDDSESGPLTWPVNTPTHWGICCFQSESKATSLNVCVCGGGEHDLHEKGGWKERWMHWGPLTPILLRPVVTWQCAGVGPHAPGCRPPLSRLFFPSQTSMKRWQLKTSALLLNHEIYTNGFCK